MKLPIIIAVIILSSVYLLPREPLVLEHLSKPRQLKIQGNRLWVAGEQSVQEFSLKDGSLVKSYGRHGQGPGEYAEEPNIHVTASNQIIIYTPLKRIAFNADGTYIDEIKFPGIFSTITPFGQKHVARSLKIQGKDRNYHYSISIYDPEFLPVKELSHHISPNPRKQINVVFFKRKFVVYHNRLYLSRPDNDGFVIDVFDLKGNRIYSIKKKTEKVAVPSKYIDIKRAEIKARKKPYWHLLKDTLYFPRYFPAIQDMVIDKQSIYIKTWINQGSNVTFLIMGIDGKSFKKVFLPEAGSLYTISNGVYYYLVDNPDKEAWELHSTLFSST